MKLLHWLQNKIFEYNAKRTRPYSLMKGNDGKFYTTGYEEDFFDLEHVYNNILEMRIVRECVQGKTGKWVITDNLKHYPNHSEFKKDGYEFCT